MHKGDALVSLTGPSIFNQIYRHAGTCTNLSLASAGAANGSLDWDDFATAQEPSDDLV